MFGKRGRDGQPRHPVNLPEKFTVEVIRPNPLGAGGDNLGALVVLPDKRRRPVLPALRSFDPPDFPAGVLVQRHDERRRDVVVHDVQAVAMQGG